MNHFKGYKANVREIAQIERILKEAKSNIASAAREEYHRLLSDEITIICDDISLGIRERPNCSLLNLAIEVLNQKIFQTETKGIHTEYNLCSAVSLIPDSEDDCTYIIFNSANPILEEAFAVTNGVEDFSFDLDERNAENTQSDRSKKWGVLEKRYIDSPILLNTTFTSQMTVDTSVLCFEEKDVRASIRARHQAMNQYMREYAAGREIHPSELMRYMDFALGKAVSEQGEADMEEMKAKLMSILPDIAVDVITKDPTALAEAPPDENNESEGVKKDE